MNKKNRYIRVHIVRFHLYTIPENPHISIVAESRSVVAWEPDKQETLPRNTKKLGGCIYFHYLDHCDGF